MSQDNTKGLINIRFVIMVLIVVILVCISCVGSYAASTTEIECADALYELGLFKGTGVKADGSPEYSLDKSPTRAEAITMLVRLLGKEEVAIAQEWETPFKDLPAWAEPYVGYAYNNGLTKGVTDTAFGSDSTASETQYLTFVLRALGYSDSEGDFKWNEAKQLTNKLDITYDLEADKNFLRGDIVEISYMALKTNLKDSNTKLIDSLYKSGSVTTSEIADVVRDKKSEDGKRIYLPDEIAEGVNSKDFAKAYGCDEDIHYIVDPKTSEDHWNNVKYCFLTGKWDYRIEEVDAYSNVLPKGYKWLSNHYPSSFDGLGFAGIKYPNLLGYFMNSGELMFGYTGSRYVLLLAQPPDDVKDSVFTLDDLKKLSETKTPEVILAELVACYKFIENLHDEFYQNGTLSDSSSEYEIAQVYYNKLYDIANEIYSPNYQGADFSVGRYIKCSYDSPYSMLIERLTSDGGCGPRAGSFVLAMNYEGITAYGVHCGVTEGSRLGHIVCWSILDGKEYIIETNGNSGILPVDENAVCRGNVTDYLQLYSYNMILKEAGLPYDKSLEGKLFFDAAGNPR